MKKSVSLSLSGIILATSLGMPYTQAKASTNTESAAIQENQNDRNRNVDSDRVARQSAKENGANLQRYDIEKQNRGKNKKSFTAHRLYSRRILKSDDLKG